MPGKPVHPALAVTAFLALSQFTLTLPFASTLTLTSTFTPTLISTPTLILISTPTPAAFGSRASLARETEGDSEVREEQEGERLADQEEIGGGCRRVKVDQCHGSEPMSGSWHPSAIVGLRLDAIFYDSARRLTRHPVLNLSFMFTLYSSTLHVSP